MAEEFLNKAGLRLTVSKIKALFARKATTLSGYGITNAYTKAEADVLLDEKVSKAAGKGLSANDFTDTLKSKLENIEAGAEANVQANWAQTNSSEDDFIKNKPALGTAAAKDFTATVREDDADLVTGGAVASAVKAAADALDARVTANEGAIETLNGSETTAGSVKKTVADAVAKIVDDAPEAYDTLKEISDWISAHPEDTAAMNAQIQENKGAIETLNGSETTAGSVAKAVKDATDPLQSKTLAAETQGATTVEGALSNLAQQKTNDSELSAVAKSGSYDDLSGKPEIPEALADLTEDTTHRVVSDTEKTAWNAKQGKTLENPLTIDETPKTTVEDALAALNEYADDLSAAVETTAGAIPAELPVNYVQLDSTTDAPVDLNEVATKYLNQIVTVFYHDTITNAPVQAHLTVFQFRQVSNSSYITQVCFVVSQEAPYYRFCAAGNWHAWSQSTAAVNLLSQANANLPNYYAEASLSESSTTDLIAVKFAPGASDDTFIIDLRGGERWLYAHGYNSQDVASTWNNQLFRLAPGAGKLAYGTAPKYDPTTHTLYFIRAAYSQLRIQQISGVKQTISITRTAGGSIPDTATTTVTVSVPQTSNSYPVASYVSGTTLNITNLRANGTPATFVLALKGSNSVGSMILTLHNSTQWSYIASYASNMAAYANNGNSLDLTTINASITEVTSIARIG